MIERTKEIIEGEMDVQEVDHSFICLLSKVTSNSYSVPDREWGVRQSDGEHTGKCTTYLKMSNNKYVHVSRGNKKVLE